MTTPTPPKPIGAERTWMATNKTGSHSCGCIGPQNGQPLCPCMMRGVSVVDGRYVQVIDHGPVVSKSQYLDGFQQQMARIFDV